ncbi:hypothetical protein EXZ48_15785 [Shinella sp. JR1-6]|nr:hypothetical protein EXZ48_15785 [Shinella sp. JR1-6]
MARPTFARTARACGAVCDVFTGMTAEINGDPQDGLGIERADSLVHLLNAEYSATHKGTTH